MVILNKKEPFILFIGDFLIFALSLWISLFLRSGNFSTWSAYNEILIPYVIIFFIWSLVFYISGLYDKYTTLLKDKMPGMIFNAQLINSALAIIFFYFLTSYGIAPKTILFINLFVSFILIYIWRFYSHIFFGIKTKTPAIIIGSGEEMKELEREVNNNPHAELLFVSSVDLDKMEGIDFKDEIMERIYSEGIKVVVVDLKEEKISPIVPHLYNLIFSGVKFFDMDKVYEDVFNRIPLSLLNHTWFLENVSVSRKFTYDLLKRLMDIVISLPLFLASLIAYPFIYLAIKFDDKGVIFSHQIRIGQNNKPIDLLKFRTMLFNDAGEWKEKGKENRVTRIGEFLRKTRLDEIPQLWNVLVGNISLIGPRPEFPDPVHIYSEQIDFYNVRHIIKPGLSGWAQILQEDHPHHDEPDKIRKTKNKLSYDLYYVKNRSVMLDLKIALRTIKTLAMRVGK